MKNFLLMLSFLTLTVSAKQKLVFDKQNIECEDKWVILPMNTDSSYNFGYIYIDVAAGLTLHFQGTFKIHNNVFVPTVDPTKTIKYRLEPNAMKLAEIPEDRYTELGIQKTPDWMQFYKKDENNIARLYRWGFQYNGWGNCSKALTYLEKANKIDPKYEGLQVELAYSYNCLEKYDKAIDALRVAILNHPDDAYINKELIYSYTKTNQLEKAAESCKSALSKCKDTQYNGENCYNLLYSFFKKKDKENFMKWVDETKKWNSNNKRMSESIRIMVSEISK